MTPEQKIKHTILTNASQSNVVLQSELTNITADTIDELFDSHNENYELQDDISEFRNGTVETDISCPSSRHYESNSVAAKMADGSWVGWTYWYGGGKHGEPEAIDWMNEAYSLDVVEEERLVVIQTFTKTKDPE